MLRCVLVLRIALKPSGRHKIVDVVVIGVVIRVSERALVTTFCRGVGIVLPLLCCFAAYFFLWPLGASYQFAQLQPTEQMEVLCSTAVEGNMTSERD